MVRSPKSGAELGGETGDKAPTWLRRIIGSTTPNTEHMSRHRITVRFPRNPEQHFSEELDAKRQHRQDGYWWDVETTDLAALVEAADEPVVFREADEHLNPDYIGVVHNDYPRRTAQRLR